MTNIGFRVLERSRKVSPSIVEAYRKVVTPHVSDNLNRVFAAGSHLKSYYTNESKLVGAALTVKTRPGDNLMVHKAIDMAEPGDVLVVDAGGDETNAIFGEIMLKLSRKQEIAGCVINGAIRDSAAFIKSDFPLYAKSVTHRGPYKDGPGEINVPISIGGMVIQPGDLILGDEDGVVSVPYDLAEDILKRVRIQEEKETDTFKAIEVGNIDRSWIDNTLKEKGCEF